MSPILLKLLSSFLMELDYLEGKPVTFYVLQWGLCLRWGLLKLIDGFNVNLNRWGFMS